MTWPVIGHARLRDVLTHAIRAKRVPQTILLAGPAGVGKFTTALAIAQAVNCLDVRDGAPCGACNVCTRIARGQFSDVIVVDRGDYASISIKVVREKFLALIGYRPFEGQKRVFIVDGADDLFADIAPFIEEYSLTFPILLYKTSEVGTAYQLRSLPSSFFIDRNGIIREVVIGGPMAEALLRTRVEEIIK